MPLSEEEARLLAQLEQSLAAEDPDLASTLRGSKLAARARRGLVLVAVAFIAGLAMLLGGVMLPSTILGVLGFIAMVASAYGFVVVWRRGHQFGGDPGHHRPGSAKSSGSFVERMEQRWNRRQDEGR